MGYNGEKGGIPRVVKDSIQFLRGRGALLLLSICFCLFLCLRHDGGGSFQALTTIGNAAGSSRSL